jgi:hypothetical protein
MRLQRWKELRKAEKRSSLRQLIDYIAKISTNTRKGKKARTTSIICKICFLTINNNINIYEDAQSLN